MIRWQALAIAKSVLLLLVAIAYVLLYFHDLDTWGSFDHHECVSGPYTVSWSSDRMLFR